MVWKCNNCEATKGVTNGKCSKCGAVQTTPMDAEAKKQAGIQVDERPTLEKEKSLVEEQKPFDK